MKPVYYGGVRGCRSAVYRPGEGWSGTEAHRYHGRLPALSKANRGMHVSPLTVAYRRRPGLKTKTVILASVAAIAGLLTLVLSGVAQL